MKEEKKLFCLCGGRRRDSSLSFQEGVFRHFSCSFVTDDG